MYIQQLYLDASTCFCASVIITLINRFSFFACPEIFKCSVNDPKKNKLSKQKLVLVVMYEDSFIKKYYKLKSATNEIC